MQSIQPSLSPFDGLTSHRHGLRSHHRPCGHAQPRHGCRPAARWVDDLGPHEVHRALAVLDLLAIVEAGDAEGLDPAEVVKGWPAERASGNDLGRWQRQIGKRDG